MAGAGPRQRVQVVNPADGGYFYWLGKLAGFALLCIIALLVWTAASIYGHYSSIAPAIPDLARYADVTPGVTRVYAGDGTLLGEFADEWREVVPYEQLPKKLIEATLAAEDHRFFEHGGIDVVGIGRAVWRNVTAGQFTQGGSTITQQVAKQFIFVDKAARLQNLSRKAKEAILARRLEATYTKEEILAVYLNHIFLGSGAYGVQAAARRYFSKNVWELGVPELALIAGLAQSPSKDSPLTSLASATRRRNEVLDKMARYGYLSAPEAEKYKAEPIKLQPWHDVFLETSPYFAEHVRRLLLKRYGKKALMQDGLTVETSVLPWLDGLAAENVDFGARKQDTRQGWRGPEAHLEGGTRDSFLERAAAQYPAPLAPGQRALALVDTVEGDGASVLVGKQPYRLPLRNMDWASKWSRTHDENDVKIGSAKEALKPGDVVWVQRPLTHVEQYADWTLDEHFNAHWIPEKDRTIDEHEVALIQPPRVQASLFTFDHQSGYVLAMIGGTDYAQSEFNRVTQACRQPGSTYKPIYYSAALDMGYGFDTILTDIPHAEVDPVTGEVWVPKNIHDTQDNQVTLEYALVFSKNVPSVDLFKRVGADNVEKWARRLGFTSEIIADRALALGASCTYTEELARAFSIFARNGRWLDLVYIRRVVARDGTIVEDHTVPGDPMLGAGDRLDRIAATAGVVPRQVIPARTAFLTSKLLRQMVREGYNGNLRQTGVISAGKTGTSSKTMDLWFIAYTSRWLTTMWLGDDLRERQLGRDDAAYMSSVPVWARYMYRATQGQKLDEIPWEVPAGVNPKDRGDNHGREAAAGPTKGIGSEDPPG